MDLAFSSVILYTFSGTGNTTKVAQMIKTNFETKGIECRLVEIGKLETLPQPPEGALVGIGFPIHAFNSPTPLMRAMRSLSESLDSQKCFIFKVSGEPLKLNNAAAKGLKRLLKRKNYETMGDYHFLMPYNIWFRYSDALANHMYRYALGQSRLIVEELTNGANYTPKRAPLRAHAVATVLKIQKPAAKLNGRLYKVDREKCTLCGVCERGCPVANIEIKDGKVNFHKHCAMCMYCAMYCPEDAISIGLLKYWKVNGPYPYTRLTDDKSLPFPLITAKTKGIRKIFIKHYQRLDQKLAEYKIEV